jgi:hypothetical protein
MQRGPALLAFVSVLCLSASSCGTLTSPAPNPSALEGNWHLTGQSSNLSVLSFNPFIALAFGLSGNTLYYSGETLVPCTDGGETFAETISGTATVAADGTFTLSSASSTHGSILYSIQGTAPAEGSTSWQGTFNLTNAPATDCDFNINGPFTATPYPPFAGTYSGAANGSSLQLKVAQGVPAVLAGPEQNLPFTLPLTGSIAVTGSSCFTSGAISNANSGVTGDAFSVLAVMNDGSTVLISGWFTDQSEKALEPVILEVIAGPCKAKFEPFTLTLQP